MGWMSSKQTTTQQLDPIQRGAIQENLSWARMAANQPFQQFQGPWSAAPNTDQHHALNQIAASGNAGVNELNMATTGARQAQSFQPMMTTARNSGAFTGDQFMSKYFNPFLSRVAGGMATEMDRARQMQIMSDEDKAIAAGAYGGSRHGVVDSETNRGFFDTLGKNIGDLFARGFDTAAGFGMQDAQRFTDVDRANADRTLSSDQGNQTAHLGAGQLRLSAADVLRGIGDTRHDNELSSATARFQAGSAMQALEQARIDRERERFNEWRDFPMRQAGIINSAVNGMPNMGGTTTSSSSNPLQTLMGLAGTGASIYGTVSMANALPALLAASDKNIKSDISFFDDDDALEGLVKTPVKSWRYDPAKGGPNDGGRPHIGPMAQDMKRNLGLGDGRALPVVDVMGTHHAAIKALAKKVDKLSRKGK